MTRLVCDIPVQVDLPLEPHYLHALNDRQREAVEMTEGPLMVIAGAGSGKTKMLTSRMAYLSHSMGVPPYQILAVTFTNKAAQEMRERVQHFLEPLGMLGLPEVGTFHSFCVRLLRREIQYTPFTKAFVIYDDSDQLSLIKSVQVKLAIDEKTINPKAVQGAINRMKCDAIDWSDFEPQPYGFFERQLKRIYEQYQKDLFASNALDFGEILCLTYRLLRDNEEVRRRVQGSYRYIHVDEYQDTNRAQYLLLSQLLQTKFGGHQNVCVVGDEDQSIYKWRGADIRNILEFEQDYPGAYLVKLEQNYRSTKTILAAANQVICNNRERKEKTLWTENADGVKIINATLADERAEAEYVVGELKRILRTEGRSLNDFAIFYRTHAQSRQFEDVFRREKIDYQIVGGLRFYDRKEIKDILCYLRLLINPNDGVSLKRIINTPGRGIGKTTIEKLEQLQNEREAQMGEPVSLWYALEVAVSQGAFSSGTTKKLANFVDLMTDLMVHAQIKSPAELYHELLDRIGYVKELKDEGTDESLARIENLEEFDSILQEFEELYYLGLPDEEKKKVLPQLLPQFLEQSSLASDHKDNRQQEVSATQLKMMTLHSSKGLEYPIVFLPGMEEGLFPSIRAWEEETTEDIEEERRLCYVGMTRAREKLYLSHVKMRRLWGNVTFQDPARFINEISDDFLENIDLTLEQQRPFLAARSFDSSKYGGPVSGFNERMAGTSQYGAKALSGNVDSKWVGQSLDHAQYGPGKIISTEGSGEDQKVWIEFRGGQRRKFLLRFIQSQLEAM